jgi:hypothetical protein
MARRPDLGARGCGRLAILAVAASIVAACSSACPTTAPTGAPPTTPAASQVAALPSVATTDEPTPPPPVDPCSLITHDEANHLAGAELQPGVAAGHPLDSCEWTAPPTASVAQVRIDIGDGAKKQYDIDHDVLNHAFTTVPGLADEAYAEDDAIYFRSGATWVAIHLVLLNDPAQNAAALVTLAKTVAGRI